VRDVDAAASASRQSSLTRTKELARRVRVHAVKMANRGGSSHVGSVLSMADLLAVLYGSVLVGDAAAPKAAQRDRFILSKGHAGSGVYAVLAETGYFSVSVLETHYQDGSKLSGHVSHKDVPGVELSTGSLGHGLSVGVGMAYAAKRRGEAFRVFVLLSDGECDEGSIWEAVLFAAHHGLDNLTVIVDYNKIQSLKRVEDTLALEPFAEKWRAFRWAVRECDGHSHAEILENLSALPFTTKLPSCLLAHTIKGKGVSFMENSVLWHYRVPRGDEFESALRELGDSP
jgi:transketolase